MVGTSFSVGAFNFVFTLIMGRMLGPIGFGTLTALTSLLYILGVPAQSLNSVIVRFVAELFSQQRYYAIWHLYRRFLWWLSILGILLVIFSFGIAPILSDFLRISDPLLVSLLAINVTIGFLTVLSQSVFQGQQRFWIYCLMDSAGVITKVALGVSLVWLGYNVRGALIAIVSANLVPFLLAFSLLIPLRRVSVDKNGLVTKTQLSLFALPSLVAFLGMSLLTNQDVVLVKRFFAPAEAGMYSALVMFGKILFFVTGAVGGVILPVVTSKYVSSEDYKRSFLKGFLLVLSLCSMFVLLISAFPTVWVRILFGSTYLSIAPQLGWVGLLYLVFSLSYIFVLFFMATKQPLVTPIPLVLSFLQIVLLTSYHNSIQQVLIVNILVHTLLLFLLTFLYNNPNLLEKLNQWIRKIYSR